MAPSWRLARSPVYPEQLVDENMYLKTGFVCGFESFWWVILRGRER